MKKIVPFNKDITFDSNIHEIKSISLEHTLTQNENNVKGNFIISGTYKMTEMSVNTDSFNYELPFEINIDKKYNTKDLKIDINDFYYEIIDSKILSVKIEVSIDNLEEKELIRESQNNETIKEQIRESQNKEIVKEEVLEENVPSIFDSLNDNEKYVPYKIHFVNENDTVESITEKYETEISKLELYNNLSEIKIGDKIIIPYVERN